MKARSISIVIMLVAIIAASFLFISCPNELDDGLTSNEVDDGPISIDRIPVFSSPSIIVPMTRSLIPSEMSVIDFYYTIFVPPIARFEETSDSFVVGDSLEVHLFDNS
ncbi:MAG: hypothetical protein WCR75_10610, partial [Sphaerochaetaceae bacterium]